MPGRATIRQKFTGYERDNETDLDFAQARFYQNTLGRFTSADPVGGSISNAQTLNKYSYVMNNPLNYVDPMGLDCVDADRSGNSDACIWVTDGNGKYGSLWRSQFVEGNEFRDEGFTEVENPGGVDPFPLIVLDETVADDPEYQAYKEEGTLVKLGDTGRFEDSAVLDYDSIIEMGGDNFDVTSATQEFTGGTRERLDLTDNLFYRGLNPLNHPLPWKNPGTPIRVPPGNSTRPTSFGSGRPMPIRWVPVDLGAPGNPTSPHSPGVYRFPPGTSRIDAIFVTIMRIGAANGVKNIGGAVIRLICSEEVLNHVRQSFMIDGGVSKFEFYPMKVEPEPKGKREEYFSDELRNSDLQK